jgi:hypothetical protein
MACYRDSFTFFALSECSVAPAQMLPADTDLVDSIRSCSAAPCYSVRSGLTKTLLFLLLQASDF